jgi:hypothetical protein
LRILFPFRLSRKRITCCAATMRKDALHYFSFTEIEGPGGKPPGPFSRQGGKA